MENPEKDKNSYNPENLETLINKSISAKIQLPDSQIPKDIDPAISIKFQLPSPESKIISQFNKKGTAVECAYKNMVPVQHRCGDTHSTPCRPGETPGRP